MLKGTGISDGIGLGKAIIYKSQKIKLDKNKINVPDILNMTNYDNDSFKYVKTTKALMKNFKKFIGDLPLLIIDNSYTRNYLEEFDRLIDSGCLEFFLHEQNMIIKKCWTK